MRELGDDDIARHSAGFFKTGPGEYGEGDRFLGIRVPVTRKLAHKYRDLPERSVLALVKSPYHEERLLAILILVKQYERSKGADRSRIADVYLLHRAYVNNWDLVDSSAHLILGPELFGKDLSLLDDLVTSESLWDRRIAVMATYHFIRQGEFSTTLDFAERLLEDPEDLIHKCTGWMLREIGKRDAALLREFLGRHAGRMPRTMLRYAIEKLPEKERKDWLAAPRLR